MVDHPTTLDTYRGMAAQKATDLRRLRSEVEADQAALHARQTELETLLAAAPAANWPEAVEKAPAICWASSPRVQQRPIRAGVSCSTV